VTLSPAFYKTTIRHPCIRFFASPFCHLYLHHPKVGPRHSEISPLRCCNPPHNRQLSLGALTVATGNFLSGSGTHLISSQLHMKSEPICWAQGKRKKHNSGRNDRFCPQFQKLRLIISEPICIRFKNEILHNNVPKKKNSESTSD
jgi:hypothetical protein